jgi:hypothetical protein
VCSFGLVILAGYLLTAEQFAEVWPQYFIIHMSYFLILLGWRLLSPRIGRSDLVHWTIFSALIIGYPTQYYLLTLLARVPPEYLPLPLDPAYSSDLSLQLRGHEMALLGLAACVIGRLVILALPSIRPAPPRARPHLPREVMILLLVTGCMLTVVTAVLMGMFDIGLMGAASVRLPYRLGGWVYYVQTAFLICLFLFLIAEAEATGYQRLYAMATACFVAYLLIHQAVSGSRGFLWIGLIQLWVCRFLRGTRVRWKLRWALVAVVAGLVMYPLLTEYRMLRATGKLSISDAAGWVAHERTQTAVSGMELSRSALAALLRPPGGQSMWIVLSVPPDGGVLAATRHFLMDPERTFGTVFTQDVGAQRNVLNYQMAPGILGALYVIGGSVACFWGILLVIVCCGLMWRRIIVSSRDPINCVAASQLLWLCLLLAQEGDLGAMPKATLAIGISLLVCHSVSRVVGVPWRSQVNGPAWSVRRKLRPTVAVPYSG